MRTFKQAPPNRAVKLGLAGTALLAALLVAAPASALDGSETPAAQTPLQLFKDPESAMRAGLQSYRTGDVKSSVEALKYAADQGYHPAQWKLGKMYADGDGVVRDDVRAYEYFLQIVNSFKDDEDEPPARRFILSNAFVAVGMYNLNGIPNWVKPNPERALHLFEFAASNFADANAEYNLGRMYLDGIGTLQNGREGVGWLDLAARKNFVWAQAFLGHVLYAGVAGIPVQRGRGLALLMVANERADKVKDAWVCDLFAQAVNSATDSDRQQARVLVAEYRELIKREISRRDPITR
jgi:TPR repeat protein